MSKALMLSIIAGLVAASGIGKLHAQCHPLPLPVPVQSHLNAAYPQNSYWSYHVLGDGTVDLGFGGSAADYFLFDVNGDDGPGTYDLGAGADADFATCGHCTYIVQDGDYILTSRVFFQDQGSVAFAQAVGSAGSTLSLTFTNLHLIEVTIDPATYASTPVPNGECYLQATDLIFGNGFDLAD